MVQALYKGADLLQSPKINPQLADAWNNKGVALSRQGKYDEAIQAYNEAIEIDPEYASLDSVLKWMLFTCCGYFGYRNANFGQIQGA
jgi:tetratricopeptide (TPR) repeat protein